MLRDETDFINNAIGIDPAGCGCLDCGIGNSIPEDEDQKITELLKAHFEEGREIVNRSGSTVVAYRNRRGDYESTWVPVSESRTNFEVIAPEEAYFDYSMDEGTVVSDDHTPEDEAEGAVKVEDDDAMKELVEKHFKHGEIIVNRTSETLVVYRTAYGESGHVSIDAENDEPLVSVLHYH